MTEETKDQYIPKDTIIIRDIDENRYILEHQFIRRGEDIVEQGSTTLFFDSLAGALNALNEKLVVPDPEDSEED